MTATVHTDAPPGSTKEDSAWYTVEEVPDERGYSGLIVGTHTEAVTLLHQHGLAPLSVRDLAKQRLRFGPWHQISWTGSRTTDVLIVDRDRFFLAHGDVDSDLWDPAAAALLTSFHADGKEIPFDLDAVHDLTEIPSNNFEVPVAEFLTHPVTNFLFADAAEDYQRWLQDAAITHLPFMLPTVALTRHHPYPFMRPLILRCTDNWSGIITANTDLHTAYGYRCATAEWAGETRPVETFPTAALRHIDGLLPLDTDVPQSVDDIVAAAYQCGRHNIIGTVLRLLRGSSDLPASHATWAPQLTGTGE